MPTSDLGDGRFEIKRNNLTLLVTQLSSACAGLQAMLQSGHAPAEATRQLIATLLKHCSDSFKLSKSLDIALAGDETTGDLLLICSVMYSTAAAFLEPDQFEEANRTYSLPTRSVCGLPACDLVM